MFFRFSIAGYIITIERHTTTDNTTTKNTINLKTLTKNILRRYFYMTTAIFTTILISGFFIGLGKIASIERGFRFA